MRLFKYLFIVFITSAAITAGATMLANKGLRDTSVGFYGKMNAAREKNITETELLMIGSSRTIKHLDPKIFDSVTGLNSYNYGLNAISIKTCYNVITYALNFQKNVKAIIVNVDYIMFDIAMDPYKEAFYYPFEKLPGMNTKDPEYNLVHQVKIFDVSLYDDYAKYAAMDGLLRPAREVEGLFKGYAPYTVINDFTHPSKEFVSKREVPVTQEGIGILTETIRLCKEKNIQLFLVVSPYYSKYFPANYITNYNAILDRVEQVAVTKGATFLNLDDLSIGDDSTNFYNVNHMNVKGATAYSLALADSINRLYIR
jgi:hypothetical protein